MSDNNNGESVKRTLREKKFIEAYIENCGNATEAYLTISPNVKRDSAKELGKRMVAKVDVSIIELLDDMGLTDPVLSQKLIDGLSATRESGKGIQRKEVTDHSIIVKYLDMALKLKSKYPAERGKYELTGKDGKSLGPQLNMTIEKLYYACPLRQKGKCPIEKEVKEAERLEGMGMKEVEKKEKGEDNVEE